MDKETFTFPSAKVMNTMIILVVCYFVGSFLYRIISGILAPEFWIYEFVLTIFGSCVAVLAGLTYPTQVDIDENYFYLYFYFFKTPKKIKWKDILEFDQFSNKLLMSMIEYGKYYILSKKLGFPNNFLSIFYLKKAPIVIILTDKTEHNRLIEFIGKKVSPDEYKTVSESIAE